MHFGTDYPAETKSEQICTFAKTTQCIYEKYNPCPNGTDRKLIDTCIQQEMEEKQHIVQELEGLHMPQFTTKSEVSSNK